MRIDALSCLFVTAVVFVSVPLAGSECVYELLLFKLPHGGIIRYCSIVGGVNSTHTVTLMC